MKNEFNEIRILMGEKKYNEAILIIEKLEIANPINPKILILKARCIYMSDSKNKYTLNDVKKLYKKVLELDNNHIEALIELGYFYYANDNNPNKAIPYFTKAIKLNKNFLIDSIKGIVKCFEETKSVLFALSYLKEARSDLLRNSDLAELEKELEELLE